MLTYGMVRIFHQKQCKNPARVHLPYWKEDLNMMLAECPFVDLKWICKPEGCFAQFVLASQEDVTGFDFKERCLRPQQSRSQVAAVVLDNAAASTHA